MRYVEYFSYLAHWNIIGYKCQKLPAINTMDAAELVTP